MMYGAVQSIHQHPLCNLDFFVGLGSTRALKNKDHKNFKQLLTWTGYGASFFVGYIIFC